MLMQPFGIHDSRPTRSLRLKCHGSREPLRDSVFSTNPYHSAFAMQSHRGSAHFQRGQVDLKVKMSTTLGHEVSLYENPSIAYVPNRPFCFL
jgi:hypothetical protein